MAVGWVVFDRSLVRVLDFSPLELILMGTAMEATIFVSEVPTGVVADTYSRRLSFIIGVIGMGGAVIGVGPSSEPWLVIALWVLWGFSYTFTSGAFEAWLTDELGVENVGSAFLRGARFRIVGSLRPARVRRGRAALAARCCDRLRSPGSRDWARLRRGDA